MSLQSTGICTTIQNNEAQDPLSRNTEQPQSPRHPRYLPARESPRLEAVHVLAPSMTVVLRAPRLRSPHQAEEAALLVAPTSHSHRQPMGDEWEAEPVGRTTSRRGWAPHAAQRRLSLAASHPMHREQVQLKDSRSSSVQRRKLGVVVKGIALERPPLSIQTWRMAEMASDGDEIPPCRCAFSSPHPCPCLASSPSCGASLCDVPFVPSCACAFHASTKVPLCRQYPCCCCCPRLPASPHESACQREMR